MLLNDIMIYSMIGISGLLLLTGNAIMFFNLLDLLQSLSYSILFQLIQFNFLSLILKYRYKQYQSVFIQKNCLYLQMEEVYNSKVLDNQLKFKQINFIYQMLKVGTFIFYVHQQLILFPYYYPLTKFYSFKQFYLKNSKFIIHRFAIIHYTLQKSKSVV
ncbi:unnamed protein product [Paramecium sonneborni]|uniref:Transmembrane protein n=1 Tax=Paramecium sonneborni TaxID=65129 RepID=A0A8S1RR80_9CILI|nr:unnamed protein product [Paramecium sonneborni]